MIQLLCFKKKAPHNKDDGGAKNGSLSCLLKLLFD